MKLKKLLPSLLLMGIAAWLAVGLFDTTPDPDGDFSIYAWLADNETESASQPEPEAAPGRQYDS
jgi:hypothetical protein